LLPPDQQGMTGPHFSRRTLLQASAALLAAPLCALADQAASRSDRTRLLKGWEYYRGDLGGIWEAWRTTKQAEGDFLVWAKVAMPHCFNDRDACDPDHAYYQGPGWYRTHLAVENPFAGGRTLLHFEGSGQKTQLYVGLEKVGEEHIGGYDQWVVDITDAASRGADKQGLVPVAIFCDSSRDLEMIPSSQSDFCLYGGLYRFVNLVSRACRSSACTWRPVSSPAGKHASPSRRGCIIPARPRIRSTCA
jgi:beta-galactosidase